MLLRSTFIAAAALVLTTGCTITRPVTDDYTQYLVNNKGMSSLPNARVAEQYYLTPSTQAHHYEFRSAMAGQANLWVVEFGKVLDATMRSADVVAALGAMNKAGSDTAANGNTLVFNLQKYTFQDHGAHIELEISIHNAHGDVFRKSYRADGSTQGGKMFFAGAFGMKNAVQQSTKTAMDSIMSQFVRDVNAAPGDMSKQ